MRAALARLLPYLLRYRRGFLVGLGCVAVTTGVSLIAPWVLRLAIDDLYAGVTRRKLIEYSAALLVIALVGATFRYLMRRIIIGVSRQIEYDLRNDFFARLQTFPLAYFQSRRTGDLMSRATNDLNAVRMTVGPAIMYSANTAVLFVVAIVLMMSIDLRLTLFALIPLPFVSIALLALGIALATDRRKAVLWMGIGTIAVTLLPVQAIYLGQYPFAQAALNLGQVPAPAAQAAYTILFRSLVRADQIFAFVGLVFMFGAMVAGPSSWATALRGGLSHGIDNIGPTWDFGPAGEWVLAHRKGMRAAGPIAGVLALLLVHVTSAWTIVWLGVAVLVWLGAVQLVGRPRPAVADAPLVSDALVEESVAVAAPAQAATQRRSAPRTPQDG